MHLNAFRVTTLPANGEPRELSPRRHVSRAADLLTVGPNLTLAAYLSALFQPSGWTIVRTLDIAAGLDFLRTNPTAVAVFEEVLPSGDWRDAAAAFASILDAPSLIVVGDDHSLTPEVLGAGGFDALIRPLRESDVVWTVASAWHAWIKRHEGVEKGVHRCSGA